jgi:hypothetical protein
MVCVEIVPALCLSLHDRTLLICLYHVVTICDCHYSDINEASVHLAGNNGRGQYTDGLDSLVLTGLSSQLDGACWAKTSQELCCASFNVSEFSPSGISTKDSRQSQTLLT